MTGLGAKRPPLVAAFLVPKGRQFHPCRKARPLFPFFSTRQSRRFSYPPKGRALHPLPPREFSTASTVSTATWRFSALASPILILLTVRLMTQAQLIKLHDHLLAHYNAHGAEEAREQICALEEQLLASIALSPSPMTSPGQ